MLDGDTIEVEDEGGVLRIRVYGIDCPEHGQPFADEARQLTASLVEGKTVGFRPLELDRLGRTVADVSVRDGEETLHLNHELLQAGLAWWYRAEGPEAHALELTEAEARQARRGLWADPESSPPWEYRRLGRETPQ